MYIAPQNGIPVAACIAACMAACIAVAACIAACMAAAACMAVYTDFQCQVSLGEFPPIVDRFLLRVSTSYKLQSSCCCV